MFPLGLFGLGVIGALWLDNVSIFYICVISSSYNVRTNLNTHAQIFFGLTTTIHLPTHKSFRNSSSMYCSLWVPVYKVCRWFLVLLLLWLCARSCVCGAFFEFFSSQVELSTSGLCSRRQEHSGCMCLTTHSSKCFCFTCLRHSRVQMLLLSKSFEGALCKSYSFCVKFCYKTFFSPFRIHVEFLRICTLL